jgi:ribonuclease III
LFKEFFIRLRSPFFFRKKDFSTKYQLDNLHLEKIKKIENIFNINIKLPHYYIKAISHKSYPDQNSNYFKKSNERLEFLGDSVLGMVVAKYLFKKYPSATEGFLTKTRSQLVNKEALVIAAEKLNLKEIVFYNERFVNGSSEGINTIIADALEAIIGAIYIDQGLKATEKIINKWILKPRFSDETATLDKNFKGQLLEFTHAKKQGEPVYKVADIIGPEHQKLFTVDVYVDERKMGTGTGSNKKAAEQEASKEALLNLKKDDSKN